MTSSLDQEPNNMHGISLHNILKTRWSARIYAVKPVALQLKSLLSAVNDFEVRSLPAEAQTQIKFFKKYLTSFECILMSTIWMKVLVLLHQTNLILQTQKATLTTERNNIDKLIEDIKKLKMDGIYFFRSQRKLQQIMKSLQTLRQIAE